MTNSDRPARVLMIGLDASEPRLVEKWMNDGTLPNLKHLQTNGSYGRLESTAYWLAGSPWPTFFTGTVPSEHGLYHYKQWRADKMGYMQPSPDWLPLRPFWRELSKTGRRVIAIDVPMTFPPESINGVEITGWATHDQFVPPVSYPSSMIDWVNREFGSPPLNHEIWGLQNMHSLFKLRSQLIQATCRVADLAKALMTREAWDLFIVGFGATHRAGHKLWDNSSTWGHIRPVDQKKFSNALRQVYIACDSAVGQLVEGADGDVAILVFSLHGMGPNTSRVYLLSKMLTRILNEKPENKSYLKQLLGQRLPYYTQMALSQLQHYLLPSRLQNRWKAFRRRRHKSSIDWTTTLAISLLADLQGYIRINLQGRETDGIVKPGEDYDRVCANIIEGLGTFFDNKTGEPIVESVIRSDQLFTKGNRLDNLPDLIVRWASSPAANHQKIVSTSYGSILWPTPGRNPDGRSGNHRPEGFLLATGNRIRPNLRIENAHILDLAPTVLALLNVNKPVEMCGNVLSILQ